MKERQEITAKVTNKLDVIIRATRPGINLEESFYAINWFSTKVEWLYHFYNFLASKSVIKIGGAAFFKARVTEIILDELQGKRELILIVRYPGGQNFKALLESTYFKVVSIFRVLSVTDFTFGFTHKIESDPNSKIEDGLHYAIHHFKTTKKTDEILKNIQAVLPKNIRIKYSGHTIASLNSQEKNKAMSQIPNLMDGLYIFQSPEEENLRALFKSDAYQTFLSTFQSSHISLLNRISI
jgi:hypothetical protein